MSNKLYIVGSIDEESFKTFSEELSELEIRANPGQRIIEIEMNSEGGTAMDALAFYSRIVRSPCIINVTAYGLIASAAVLVFAACDTRRMAKECWMMVHEDTDDTKGLKTSEVEKQAKQARAFENQWNTLLEERSTTSSKKWAALHAVETYLTAEQCKELGIVDQII